MLFIRLTLSSVSLPESSIDCLSYLIFDLISQTAVHTHLLLKWCNDRSDASPSDRQLSGVSIAIWIDAHLNNFWFYLFTFISAYVIWKTFKISDKICISLYLLQLKSSVIAFIANKTPKLWVNCFSLVQLFCSIALNSNYWKLFLLMALMINY